MTIHTAVSAYWNYETEDGLWSRDRLDRPFPLIQPWWRKVKTKMSPTGKPSAPTWVLESQVGVMSKYVATVRKENHVYLAGIRGFFWRQGASFVNVKQFTTLGLAQEGVSDVLSRRPTTQEAPTPFTGYPEALTLPGNDLRRRLLIHAAKMDGEGWYTTGTVLRQGYEEITRLTGIYRDHVKEWQETQYEKALARLVDGGEGHAYRPSPGLHAAADLLGVTVEKLWGDVLRWTTARKQPRIEQGVKYPWETTKSA